MIQAPSIYAHALNGILLLIAVIILFRNWNKMMRLKPDKMIEMVLFFSLVIGVHAISHLGLETVYGLNPWTN